MFFFDDYANFSQLNNNNNNHNRKISFIKESIKLKSLQKQKFKNFSITKM